MCTSSEIETGWVLILTILAVAVAGFVFIALPVVNKVKDYVHNPLYVAPTKKEEAEMEFEAVATTDRHKTEKYAPTKGDASEIVSSHSSFESTEKKVHGPVDSEEEGEVDRNEQGANYTKKTTQKAAI